jgi:hypothetical protein
VQPAAAFSKMTGDKCNIKLQCQFEESLQVTGNSKWFEARPASTLFYLSQNPLPTRDYGLSTHEMFGSLVGSDGLIP